MTAANRLLNAYRYSLQQVNGAVLTQRWAQTNPLERSIYLLAVGKAAAAMARGAAQIFGRQIVDSCVVTKYGNHSECPFLIRFASHPVPDENSLAAGAAVQAFVASVPADACLLVLLSGGTSSLIEILPSAVSLTDYQQIMQFLLSHHFDIHQINRVRKHLSLIKGGKLLSSCNPDVPVIQLLISDVSGDDVSVIGSGPFVHDDRAIDFELPAWIAQHCQAKTRPAISANVVNHLLASNASWLQHFCHHLQAPLVSWETLAGDTQDWAMQAAKMLAEGPSGLYLWGGECTMQLPDCAGNGGRLQHLVLALLREALPAQLTVLAAASDGADGKGNAAGVLLDAQQLANCRTQMTSLERAWRTANSYAFWQQYGGHLFCSATETNVVDLVAIIKE